MDALRGIAALCVVFQHVLWFSVAGFDRFSTELFSIGRTGVVVFFLISGFVIPMSLGRSSLRTGRDLGSFWIGRVFRLYPAYWASLLLIALIGWGFPAVKSNAIPIAHWALNATMLHPLFGIPDANPVAWTLFLELFVYIGFSVAGWRGWLLRPGRLVGFVAAGLFVAGIVLPLVLHRRFPGGGLACLAAGLAGYAAYVGYAGTLRFRIAALAVAGCLVLTLAGNYLSYVVMRGGTNVLEPEYAAAASATIFGYALAGLALVARERPFPRTLVALGTVSYSLYLLHSLALWFVPVLLPAPAALGSSFGAVWKIVLEVGASLLLAAAGYRLVELPANRLGRSLRARYAPRPIRADPEAGPATPGVAETISGAVN